MHLYFYCSTRPDLDAARSVPVRILPRVTIYATAVVTKYDTEAEMHVAKTFGKVMWPCNGNRDEHAGKKKVQDGTPDRLQQNKQKRKEMIRN